MIASLQTMREDRATNSAELHGRSQQCGLILHRWQEIAIASQRSDPQLTRIAADLQARLRRVQALLGRAQSIRSDPLGLRSVLATSVMGLRDVELSIQHWMPRFTRGDRRPSVLSAAVAV